MILELDLGNTRGKWRILDAQGAVQCRGADGIDRWIDQALPSEWLRPLQRIRAASVLQSQTNAALAQRVQAALGLRIEFAISGASCAGVRNAYSEPAKLGVDRWLALIAAYRALQSAVLVVDAGSALTVDAVDGGGVHLGGYIVPGAHLMERALLDGTDRVRFDAGMTESFDFGANTGACVHNGIVAAQCGVVLVALHAAAARLGVRPALAVAGGWALQAADHLVRLGVADINVMPDLVLDGLQWVLPN